jgi:hypothetical protein
MKKIFCILTAVLLVSFLAPASYAQEGLRFSGEAKSGIYWRSSQVMGDPKDELTGMHSMDDAGGETQSGRFRLNMDYENANGFGFKTRVQAHEWGEGDMPLWSYAFGYGNFFENQLTVAVGRLGSSPWGTGGPELWKELEDNSKTVGARIEYKPSWIPEEYGKLNVGVVFNNFNGDRDQGWEDDQPITIGLILQESVIGASYTHDLFLVRMAYRLDGKADAIQANKLSENPGMGEDEIVYRVEEYILKNYVPGLKFWALGHLFGISADGSAKSDIQWFRNYGFIEYEPPEMFSMSRPFTAQIRIGNEYIFGRQVIHVKPSFYWNFFDKMITVGASFSYGQDYGAKLTEDSPYSAMELEPKIQINFQSSYIAFVYNWKSEYINEGQAVRVYEGETLVKEYDPIKQTHRLNLRFCIYF